MLGWSDGGITALIAAAKYPSYISKMVIWGANAYVTDEDEKIYQGGLHPGGVVTSSTLLALLCLVFIGINKSYLTCFQHSGLTWEE